MQPPYVNFSNEIHMVFSYLQKSLFCIHSSCLRRSWEVRDGIILWNSYFVPQSSSPVLKIQISVLSLNLSSTFSAVSHLFLSPFAWCLVLIIKIYSTLLLNINIELPRVSNIHWNQSKWVSFIPVYLLSYCFSPFSFFIF